MIITISMVIVQLAKSLYCLNYNPVLFSLLLLDPLLTNQASLSYYLVRLSQFKELAGLISGDGYTWMNPLSVFSAPFVLVLSKRKSS